MTITNRHSFPTRRSSDLKRTLSERDNIETRPFVCPECNETFKRLQELKRHSTVHSEIRPFKCTEPGCLATFKRIDELKKQDRKSTRLNSSHTVISYAVFC